MHTPHIDNLLRTNLTVLDAAYTIPALRQAVEVLREIREGTPVPRRAAGIALDTIEHTLASAESERASPQPHEPPPMVPREHHGEPCPTCGSHDTTGEAPELACHACGRSPYPEGD